MQRVKFLKKLFAFLFVAENGKSVINIYKINKKFGVVFKEFVKSHQNVGKNRVKRLSMATPSIATLICWYMMLPKLNFKDSVALYIS